MKLPIPFDNPDTYPGHSGVDFGQSRGTPFRASGPGVVTMLGYSNRAGYTIWVRYDIGCEVGYVHMDSHGDCPAPLTRVVEGSFLGYVGGTGTNSTGPHLHAEVEGHSTTAGFWRWFTPDRVVGHGSPSKDPAPDKSDPSEEDEMPDSMFAVVDGTPSWCWVNWANGSVYSVHTQADANWVGSYMGSVRKNFSKDADGGTARYKNLLALLKILNP